MWTEYRDRNKPKEKSNIRWIPIVTYEYGWNLTKRRPATKKDKDNNICLCEYCAGNFCHYGSHYCKRFNEKENGRFYPDHKERW